MKIIFFILFLTISLFGEVKVATAGNVAFAIKELAKEFYKKTSIRVVPIISSSGKLSAQIERGAPFDLFLSADMRYPNYLYKKGVGVEPPKVYAIGKLIFFSKNGSSILDCQKIAIANPKTAPYGKATIEYLKNSNLYSKVKDRFVIGGNIASAFNYAIRVTDCGFVAKSLLFKFPNLNNKNHYTDLDSSKYTPIKQGVLLLNRKEESLKFYNFLFSDEGREIFGNFGYRTE